MTAQLVWFKCPECGNKVAGLEGSSGWCVGSLQSAAGRHRARRMVRAEAREKVSA